MPGGAAQARRSIAFTIAMTLFKYTRPERIDVLQNLEIRFTQPGARPFELGRIPSEPRVKKLACHIWESPAAYPGNVLAPRLFGLR